MRACALTCFCAAARSSQRRDSDARAAVSGRLGTLPGRERQGQDMPRKRGDDENDDECAVTIHKPLKTHDVHFHVSVRTRHADGAIALVRVGAGKRQQLLVVAAVHEVILDPGTKAGRQMCGQSE